MYKAGMTTADILKSATDASPLKNIEELLNVDFVMKGGKVFKHNL